MYSEHADDVELRVVSVLPEGRFGEVGIVEELPASLRPADRLVLGMPVEDCRVCAVGKHTG